MRTFIAKLIVILTALTLVVPESYARRMGGGRSVGRQAQTMRQRSTPVPPVQRQQPTPQPMPRQPVPPVATPRNVPPPATPAAPFRRQASSGFGGILTGALIGMGLGSLIASNNSNQHSANQSSGASGDWSDGSGNNSQQPNATPPAQQQEGNPYGALLLLALIAFAVRYLVKRRRARQLTQGYARNGMK